MAEPVLERGRLAVAQCPCGVETGSVLRRVIGVQQGVEEVVAERSHLVGFVPERGERRATEEHGSSFAKVEHGDHAGYERSDFTHEGVRGGQLGFGQVPVGDIGGDADMTQELTGRVEARASPRLDPSPLPVGPAHPSGRMERVPLRHGRHVRGGVLDGVVGV